MTEHVASGFASWSRPASASGQTRKQYCGRDDDQPQPAIGEFSGVRSRGIAFFGHDEFVAVARKRKIHVFRFADLMDEPRHGCGPMPVATLEAPRRVVCLAARGPSRPYELVVGIDNHSIWSVDLTAPESGHLMCADSRFRSLAKHVEGSAVAIVSTRSRLLVHVRLPQAGCHALHEIDTSAGRGVLRTVELPFTDVLSIAPLSPVNDTLVVIDSSRHAHLVGIPDKPATEPKIGGLHRVTAALALDHRYIVVAQKGGVLIKAKLRTTTTHPEAIDRLCEDACQLDRVCACEKGRDGHSCPSNDGGGPGETCDEKHLARLGWTVASLRGVGEYLLAESADSRNMAVLDRRLNVVFERFLGPKGGYAIPGATTAERMVILRHDVVEALALREFVPTLPGQQLRLATLSTSVSTTKSRVYRGRRCPPALPNPDTLRIAVFAATEVGLFGDPDQTKLIDQVRANVFDVVNDYYRENSYGAINIEAKVYGHDFDETGESPSILERPLELPRNSISSYFFDAFSPGGVQVEMPANWTPMPGDSTGFPVFDGTESLTIRSFPRFGSGQDYPVSFAVLWTSVELTYPVNISFDGTEKLTVIVADETGFTRTLDLDFDPMPFPVLNQGDDEATFLAELGSYVTAMIRRQDPTGELLQDVTYRRIREIGSFAKFGRLQGQFRVAPPATDPAVKKTLTLTAPTPIPAALASIGLTGLAIHGHSGLLTDQAATKAYLTDCLVAARTDAANIPGADDPHFDAIPVVDELTAVKKMTVLVKLMDLVGGERAYLQIVDPDRLVGTGWTDSEVVHGSESNFSSGSAARDSGGLIDAVFTKALDRIYYSDRTWDLGAVRAMLDGWDLMMVAFVGAPPPPVPETGPARWNCDDPADFHRLRMFARPPGVLPTDQDPVRTAGYGLITMDVPRVCATTFGGGGNPAKMIPPQFLPSLMAHETGHTLAIGGSSMPPATLPDLYVDVGYRDDVRYMRQWDLMDSGYLSHFSGWAKLNLGWITDDPSDADRNRVITVPGPDPTETVSVEAWLVPVEYWDPGMKDAVRALVGGDLPIVQLMKVVLGSDGDVYDLIELRAPGARFSHYLPTPAVPNPLPPPEAPPSPTTAAVLCTNGLNPASDTRWLVGDRYRRCVHLLNGGHELTQPGDVFDFAAPVVSLPGGSDSILQEFPVKGCTVTVVSTITIGSAAIPVFHVRVDRENSEFIDLYFEGNVPSWECPDLWVDWRGNNIDANTPQEWPPGQPKDQGDPVVYPPPNTTGSPVEPHFVVARVHNSGTVRAEKVKVKWFVGAPGAGDAGQFAPRDTKIIPVIQPGTFEIVAFDWNVTETDNMHLCLRAEIIDWTIPVDDDPTGSAVALASDDVALQNNNAQKNVFTFEMRDDR